jgi:hypothetical protein
LVLKFSTSFSQNDTLILAPVNNLLLNNYNLRKMAADRENNLWFGTDKGIVKFDGNDLTVFETKEGDSNTLSINSLGCIFFDKADNLYTFGVSSYIDFLNTRTGKIARLKIKLREEDITKRGFPWVFTSIYIENDSSLWAGMFNIGFINFNRYTNKTTYYSIPKKFDFQNGEVYVIRGDRDDPNKLWLATDDGIYSFDKKTQKLTRNFHCSNPKDSTFNDLIVRNIDTESKDTIWFTVRHFGFACYDIKSGAYTVFIDKDKKTGNEISHHIDINELQRKNDREIYMTSEEETPGVFNTITHTYNYFTKIREQYPAIQQKHYLADNLGNFWSLVFYQLYKGEKNTKRFQTIICPNTNRDSYSDNFKLVVRDEKLKRYYVFFDGRNEVIMVNDDFKNTGSIPINFIDNQNPGSGPSILDAILDKNGLLWICGSTIWIYDKIAKKMNPLKTPQKIDFTPMLLQNMVQRSDYIYFQPSRYSFNAIYRININTFNCDSIPLPKEITNDTTIMNQHDKRMDVLEIDKKGEVAYLCYGLSLYQFNLVTKKVRKIITYPSTDKEVKGFQHFYNMFWYKLDDFQNLWVATLPGIKIYDPNTLQVIKEIPREQDAYPLELFHADKEKIMCYLYSNGVILYDYINNRQFRLSLSDGLATIFNSGITVSNNILFIGAYDYFHWASFSDIIKNKDQRRCYLSKITLFNKPFATDSLPEYLHTLILPHDKNSISLTFSATEFDQPELLEYRYKLTGIDNDWVNANYLNRTISYNSLKPGNYAFLVNIKNTDGTWSDNGVNLSIDIIPAWWQTTWFKIVAAIIVGILIDLIISWRIKSIRKQEQLRGRYEKELLELEAKALRAQMNPHFIFNCMNSIKSLIQEDEKSKAVLYLTTFSKLIRTVFQNSDKREITLYDEIETCRLYTQLESMRFGNKFNYAFNIDETLDMRSVMVPALIIQPFIENAIWHGIMPKEGNGVLTVTVNKKNNLLQCIIDDNGIGREMSKQNKFQGEPSTHQSKGVHLTQARLNLDNLLNERNGNMEIIDKKDTQGKPIGTTIVITFSEY